MLKVVVTQRVDYIKGYEENRDALDQKLSEWLIEAELLPIPISNKLVILNKENNKNTKDQQKLENWLSNVNPNGLLLSGGNDIGEYPERDETENFLLDWAYQNRIPVLGICRGMQMMAIWAGGKLDGIINLTFWA